MADAPPNEAVPDMFGKVIEEQKLVIAEMAKKIEALEAASAAADAKITALTGQAAAQTQVQDRQPTPEELMRQRQEAAYEKVLQDLGLRKKE